MNLVNYGMKILKFGGSSLIHTNNNILNAIDIIVRNAKTERIGVVLSAPHKITNYLILLVNSLSNRSLVNHYLLVVKRTFIKIIKLISTSNIGINFDVLCLILINEFNNLSNMVIELIKLNTLRQCDVVKIISWGEKLIVLIMDKVVKVYGFHVTIIDPTKKILANGNYLESVVDINTSIRNINNMIIPNANVILMPGFIAGNKYCELVLLGRNSSDYSAIILAVCLKAKKCEIWKDVDGIYDQDPKFSSKAKLFKYIYYNDLLNLIKPEFKILHLNSVFLAKKFNIDCIIKNINNPNLSGTILLNNN
ncbi:MAG: hypothetical protein N4P92_02545 [Candidatus Lightella neohaematopini]|nr:hypothetical protein [Candidatus Lightella neohaematopini]